MPQHDPSKSLNGVTKVVEHKGYILHRTDPYGFWHIAGRVDDKPIPVAWKDKLFTSDKITIAFIEDYKK